LMVETMPDVGEAVAALRAARETGLPTTVGFVCAAPAAFDGSVGGVRLLSGETLVEAVARVEPLGPVAILVNCAAGPVVTAALGELRHLTRLPTGGYANAGVVDPVVGWAADPAVTPDAYAEEAGAWLALGARLVGGCCGTTPAHTAALRRLVDGWPGQPGDDGSERGTG
jgi:S-methylmethionine-dependent homocysteine/selenocysteine methylase